MRIFITLLLFSILTSFAACGGNKLILNDNHQSEICDEDIFPSKVSTFHLKDTFNIVLLRNKAGGYEWLMERNPCIQIIDSCDSVYRENGSILNEYAKIYRLQASDTGTYLLNFHKRRSFEPPSLAIKNAFTQTIKIK